MFSNQNRKLYTNSYSNNLSKTSYCCQSPNTCVVPNRTQADKDMINQFNKAIGNDQKETDCVICPNVNLIN